VNDDSGQRQTLKVAIVTRPANSKETNYEDCRFLIVIFVAWQWPRQRPRRYPAGPVRREYRHWALVSPSGQWQPWPKAFRPAVYDEAVGYHMTPSGKMQQTKGRIDAG